MCNSVLEEVYLRIFSVTFLQIHVHCGHNNFPAKVAGPQKSRGENSLFSPRDHIENICPYQSISKRSLTGRTWGAFQLSLGSAWILAVCLNGFLNVGARMGTTINQQWASRWVRNMGCVYFLGTGRSHIATHREPSS